MYIQENDFLFKEKAEDLYEDLKYLRKDVFYELEDRKEDNNDYLKRLLYTLDNCLSEFRNFYEEE